uniref:Deoxyribodipyrimidine photo-lyase n=2 Tax=Rhodnius prolixus TaxID=13249 RepID=T1HKC6_RHOPR
MSKKLKTHNTPNFTTFKEFLSNVERQRIKECASVLDFKFNKTRVRVLSSAEDVPEDAKGVLYWLTRESRVQDNWSLLFAQRLALKYKIPLHVCFCLHPKFMDSTIRHYKFLLKGLQEVNNDLKTLSIPLHLFLSKEPTGNILTFVKEHKIGCVVIDFSPLRLPKDWAKKLKEALPENIPLCQVDGHNIVPCWIASDKLEYSARTIRKKISDKLDEYLTEFPAVIKHPHNGELKIEDIDWVGAENSLEVDMTVGEVDWAAPGYRAGMQTLYEFCEKRLEYFSRKRNDPLADALSNLSPWIHFGQISVQRCILYVSLFKTKYVESVNAFCEEAIVRRELADNFCYYNEKYDQVEGANEWAITTLDKHRADKRTYLYGQKELEESRTHDDLWNSAQIQLVKEGKMHGFLRMYWAKKILEWTSSPEEALRIALYLNDRYSLDGRDPNGFVGCMWSICGIHDQGWREREIFGKIRYMNYEGCRRKFDVPAFVARYGGKVYSKNK